MPSAITPSSVLSAWCAALLDLVVPAECAACGAPGTLACDGCLGALADPPYLAWPEPAPDGLPPPFAAAAYADPVRALVLAYKERGAAPLARPLGRALGRSVVAAHRVVAPGCRELLLVPVPSSPAARRARGHDHVRALCRRAAGVARRYGVPARAVPVLRHVRTVADSAGLTADARHRNLHGALECPASRAALLAGRLVVVVDDIVTTGATLAEATRAVTSAGGDAVAAAVVAATPRRLPPSSVRRQQKPPGAGVHVPVRPR